jgi:PIN domain nuclease of toxin-antitoxin system
LRLLLDTQVFLWWAAKERRLSEDARLAIASPESLVFVSAVVAWEMGIKRRLQKLEAPADPSAQIKRHLFTELPITVEHAVRAAELPLHHRDPFDRLLIAQAQIERLTLVTRDPKIGRYEVPVLAA